MTVRPLIHEVDPYDGFVPVDSEVKGWNSQHPKLAELIQLYDPKLIIEVGSWLGASALWMAEHTKAEIVCIDTWAGSVEMWLDFTDKGRYGALKLRNGYPTIYQDFLSNVVRWGKQDQITPFPVPSSVGLPVLKHFGVKPDLIYIDGDHSYFSVKADIEMSIQLKPKIICGDDFHSWPGVAAAVVSILPGFDVDHHGFWWKRVSSLD